MGFKMEDIYNVKSYKKCHKKAYTVHLSMPPKNTVVINKVLYSDIVRQLGNKSFFLVDDYANNPTLKQNLMTLVQQNKAHCTKAFCISRYTRGTICIIFC